MGQIIKDQKDVNRKISYEDISTDLENNENYSYSIDDDDYDSEIIIKKFLIELRQYLTKKDLNDSELKLGEALIELFNNYNSIFMGNSNNKFNKNVILLSLREMTNLSTKEIRNSLKKFKKIYINMVEKIIR
jgi:hypothetical protein